MSVGCFVLSSADFQYANRYFFVKFTAQNQKSTMYQPHQQQHLVVPVTTPYRGPPIDFDKHVQHYLPQYISTDNELRELMPSLSHFTQQEAQVQQVQQQVNYAQNEVNRLTSVSRTEKEKVDALKTTSFSSIIARVQNKHSEKLQKHETAYYSALNKEQEAKQKLSVVQQQLNQERSNLSQIAVRKQRFEFLKGSMDSLLETIFAQAYTAHPQLFEMNQQLIQISHKANDITKALNQYQSCEKCLITALSSLDHASRRLENAVNMATADVFLNRNASYMVDSIKYSDLYEARDAANSAQQNIQQAVNLVPSLSGAIFTANVTKGAIVMDMFFDNIFTDLIIRDKIQKSLSQVRTSIATVNQAINFIRNALNTIRSDLSNANQQVSSLKYRIEVDRHRIMQGYLQSRNVSALPSNTNFGNFQQLPDHNPMYSIQSAPYQPQPQHYGGHHKGY
jgi:DNA repair exonuclease SbcCD ATPase subunit